MAVAVAARKARAVAAWLATVVVARLAMVVAAWLVTVVAARLATVVVAWLDLVMLLLGALNEASWPGRDDNILGVRDLASDESVQ